SRERTFLDSARAQGHLQTFARRWIDARADSVRQAWQGQPESFAEGYELPASVYSQFLRFLDQEEGGRPPHPTADAGARDRVEAYVRSRLGQRLFGPEAALRIRNVDAPFMDVVEGAWAEAGKRATQYPVQN
ncbi:MAG: hypothetical protein R6T83_12135, partial [Salinibacter sp.]